MKGEHSARMQSIKSIEPVYIGMEGMDAHVSRVNLACTGDKCATMYQPEAYVKHGTTGAYPRPGAGGCDEAIQCHARFGAHTGPMRLYF